jgi:putative transposase
VLKRKHPKPRIGAVDKIFWLLARRFWSTWKQSLVLVNPETVVRWHRAGFRLYWSLISRARRRVGGKKMSKEVRDLIFQMVAENPNWGAPRIHGELLMLGFEVSERTISRWMKRAPRDPEPVKRWRTFLENHKEAIAAQDFFTVPEEAVVNAMIAAETMTGVKGHTVIALPHDRLRELLKKYNRLAH